MGRSWLLCLVLGACGGKKEEQPAPRPEAKPTPDAQAPATDAAPAPAPVAPEVLAPGYYRAPGATAALRFPALDDHWSIHVRHPPSGPFVGLHYSDPDLDRSPGIKVRFPPGADHPVTAEEVTEAAVAEIPWQLFAKRVDARAVGPDRYSIRLKANPASRVHLQITYLGIVDGPNAAIVILTGDAQGLKVPAVLDAHEAVIGGVAVGAQQPSPPAHDPGTPLDAVFLTNEPDGHHRALVFDPRGYVHDAVDVVADLDAMWAIRDGKLDRYTFDGKTVAIGARRGTVDGDELIVDGVAYCRGSGDLPARLAGHWASSDQHLYFTDQGRYAHAPADDRGSYEITEGRLVLEDHNGAFEVRPIYTRPCDGRSTDILYVAGAIYSRVP